MSAALWLHHDDKTSAAQAAENRDYHTGSGPLSPRAADEGQLYAHTAKIIGDSKNQMSVYFLRPNREIEPFIYNGKAMSPASMVKLFIMAKAMQDVHDGKLSLDEKLTIQQKNVVGGAGRTTWYDVGEKRTIRELITAMIVDSDNTTTNMLIDRLGLKDINAYLSQQGYKDTVVGHKMMLSNRGRKNLSSVRDIGRLLSRLYYHQLVGEDEDGFMLDILKKQHDQECFPAALPGHEIAHKTGEVTGVYADGGIIFGKCEDCILVLINNGTEGRAKTIDQMQQLAQYYVQTMEH
ncbi:MAG: class A beta-lactamase-related serine hydrolase [Selenomonas sp.]|uniref:serine hydrolase n=1 Tax=Selenomonas sp. TaxID=2053611 RepID=UPI0025EA7BCB|nr:serine hydrolase [Selenomonas sp.]MCR5757997.1 class A beta-lactamase-related serine hydrolase [Selenomonas sp.]